MALYINRDHIWRKLRNSRFAQCLLLPCSLVFSLITHYRLRLYQLGLFKSQNPVIPTICVGNISVGGTGKTPLVAYLAKQLSAKSRIGILTRGYGSQTGQTAPYLASSNSTAALIGDEAKLYQLLLKDDPPIIVISADRIAGVNTLKEAGAEICIMDDGLQHFKINPHIKICLIDIMDHMEYFKTGSRTLLPTGILRESIKDALPRIDRLVFTSKNKIENKEKQTIRDLSRHIGISSYSIIEFQANRIRDGYSGEVKQIEESASYILLTAIAKPELLIQSWKELGAKISRTITLPDHHLFSEREWNDVSKTGTVLCSGKDWVKLIPFLKKEDELLVLQQDVVDFSEPGEELLAWVKSYISI